MNLVNLFLGCDVLGLWIRIRILKAQSTKKHSSIKINSCSNTREHLLFVVINERKHNRAKVQQFKALDLFKALDSKIMLKLFDCLNFYTVKIKWNQNILLTEYKVINKLLNCLKFRAKHFLISAWPKMKKEHY